MSRNPLGKVGGRLAAQRQAAQEATGAPASVPGGDTVHGKRRRGAGPVVAQTVRLGREDWVSMNEIKLATGMSSQEQFMAALAMWFDHNNKAPPVGPAGKS